MRSKHAPLTLTVERIIVVVASVLQVLTLAVVRFQLRLSKYAAQTNKHLVAQTKTVLQQMVLNTVAAHAILLLKYVTLFFAAHLAKRASQAVDV